jgi:hypothetical protein
VILHAKRSLLKSGAAANVIPRRLKLRAVLLRIHLPHIGGVKLTPFESFWGPTRASGQDGEFANLDLDNPEAGACDVCSEVADIWDVDFAQGAEDIAEALRARPITFDILRDIRPAPRSQVADAAASDGHLEVNAVAWWFESRLDGDEANPYPALTNVPIFLRENNVGGGTHWHQAVAALGPHECEPGGKFVLNVRTDGKKIAWRASGDAPDAQEALREKWLDAARTTEETAQMTLWRRQREATDVGDAHRVASLKAAAMHVGCQPGLFGVMGGSSVASHILKEFFGEGCSAGF